MGEGGASERGDSPHLLLSDPPCKPPLPHFPRNAGHSQPTNGSTTGSLERRGTRGERRKPRGDKCGDARGDWCQAIRHLGQGRGGEGGGRILRTGSAMALASGQHSSGGKDGRGYEDGAQPEGKTRGEEDLDTKPQEAVAGRATFGDYEGEGNAFRLAAETRERPETREKSGAHNCPRPYHRTPGVPHPHPHRLAATATARAPGGRGEGRGT